MGVHSGRYALADGLGTLRNWTVNDTQTLAKAIASNTAWGTESNPGVHDWGGDAACFGQQPPIMPGQTFDFLGYEAPTNDASGVGAALSGVAIVAQLVVNLNFGAQEKLNYQLSFNGHMALTPIEAQAPPLDLTDPDLWPPGGLFLEWSKDGTTWNEWTDVTTATLTFTNALQTYVNSSTWVPFEDPAPPPAPQGAAWTGRKPGNLDFTLSVVEHSGDRTRFNKGDQLVVRFPAGGGKFWLLEWVRVKDFAGLQVNRETAVIIQQTVSGEMSGVKEDNSALGRILMPDGTTYWPIAQS